MKISITTGAAVLASFVMASSCLGQSKHPNIIVILADDFGVGDIQAELPQE